MPPEPEPVPGPFRHRRLQHKPAAGSPTEPDRRSDSYILICHSLALAEAFLAPLHAVGLPERETGLAFSLVYDYTLGFALSSPNSVNEQRVQDTETRNKLHAFLRSLPADRFPTLVALGEHVWLNNRDERFTAGLDTLVAGLETAARAGAVAAGNRSTDQNRAAPQPTRHTR